MTNRRTRQGKQFEDECRASLIHLSEKWERFWWTRIYDAKSYYAINPRLQAPKTPCDFMALCNGRLFAIECKSSSTRGRYAFQYVKEHQKQSLLAIDEAGGEGWILLSWRRWSHTPRKANRLWGFRIKSWLAMEAEEEKKSVAWQTVIQKGKEFKRHPPYWELDSLFMKVRN